MKVEAKKYKLLKDLPNVKKGALVKPFYSSQREYKNYSWMIRVNSKLAEGYFFTTRQMNNPKWFQHIYE